MGPAPSRGCGSLPGPLALATREQGLGLEGGGLPAPSSPARRAGGGPAQARRGIPSPARGPEKRCRRRWEGRLAALSWGPGALAASHSPPAARSPLNLSRVSRFPCGNTGDARPVRHRAALTAAPGLMRAGQGVRPLSRCAEGGMRGEGAGCSGGLSADLQILFRNFHTSASANPVHGQVLVTRTFSPARCFQRRAPRPAGSWSPRG